MTKIYKINGLDCANCAAKFERKLEKVKGVDEVNVDFISSKLIVDARLISDDMINKFNKIANELGYTIENIK